VAEKQFFTFESQISDKERFREAEPLSLRCMSCEGTFAFDGIQDNSVGQKGKGAKLILVKLDTADRGSVSGMYRGRPGAVYRCTTGNEASGAYLKVLPGIHCLRW
jgi:hypothetical protein